MIKYEGILENARDGRYRASLITLEFGSREEIYLSGFHQLKNELQVFSRDFSCSHARVTHITITEPFKNLVQIQHCTI